MPACLTIRQLLVGVILVHELSLVICIPGQWLLGHFLIHAALDMGKDYPCNCVRPSAKKVFASTCMRERCMKVAVHAKAQLALREALSSSRENEKNSGGFIVFLPSNANRQLLKVSMAFSQIRKASQQGCDINMLLRLFFRCL